MERVVGHGFAIGLFHPRVEGMAQRLAFVLNREIDQRGRAAEGRGARAGLEIVGAGGAAERHVQMRMHVDAAGNDDAALGVENLGGVVDGKFLADRDDLAIR